MASRKASQSITSDVPRTNVHLVVGAVGDGAVGKTCLLLTYLSGKYPTSYLPGAMDWNSEYDHLTRYPVKLQKDGVEVSLSLVDTVGLDEYQKLRAVVCASVDVFLLCFDIGNPASLERVRHHWVPEVREYSETASLVLVGTKSDLRITAQIEGRPSTDTVSFAQARAVCQEIGASNYYECSAKTMTGVKKLFDEIAMLGVSKAYPDGVDKKGCTLS